MTQQVKPKETDLYPPIKAFLEGQGYSVKGEVTGADVVALKDDCDPVVVELKTGFSLTLFHQAIERLRLTDMVYIAVPRGSGKAWLKSHKANKSLCRRLGIGLITVRMRDTFVEVHLDPGPYTPRKTKYKQARMLREFARREGDPNLGGSPAQTTMTAYRQDALKVATYLAEHGASKGSVVAHATAVPTATRIMASDHYGWFERVEKGIYQLTPNGQKGLEHTVCK
ncbi:DUF2161 domain-containing phosphodiesterase [Algirhabdus cladophorae]|uniref:DUF2161 domain-containing phosphodiesterase n=1 Tax=Algirhabdus cladophorae TaxID=3377108 RepID=UPI003B84ABD0